jgi:ubiquitin
MGLFNWLFGDLGLLILSEKIGEKLEKIFDLFFVFCCPESGMGIIMGSRFLIC